MISVITHKPVDGPHRPTHHSTGPEQKTAQAGEFKRSDATPPTKAPHLAGLFVSGRNRSGAQQLLQLALLVPASHDAGAAAELAIDIPYKIYP